MKYYSPTSSVAPMTHYSYGPINSDKFVPSNTTKKKMKPYDFHVYNTSINIMFITIFKANLKQIINMKLVI